MKQFLFFLSFIFATYASSQDTLALNNIPEAIEEAKKGNFVSLGLLNRQEKEFPSDFFKIPKEQLIGLVVDNCKFESFPSRLKGYKNLLYFRYSWFLGDDCPITSFPTFLQSAEAIQVIIIERAPIKTVPSLTKLTSLESLSLTSCELSVFPNSVLEVTSLTKLDLACNSFTSIPSDIDKLSKLESLEFDAGACGGTPISSVPQSIGNLTQLQSFSLGYTKKPLETLPDSFYNLTNLKSFKCDGCGITSFSDKIGNLTKLQSIVLINVKYFEAFPEEFFKLTELRVFYFYQYGTSASPNLLKQENRLKTWGESIKSFDFDINLK